MRERSFIVALILAAGLSPLVKWLLLRIDIVDQPNERSSHTIPTPRGGGIAVALAASLALIGAADARLAVAVVASSACLGVAGFIDDRRSVDAAVRLACQLLVPACVLPLLLRGMPIGDWWTWTFALGIVVWTATYVNAFNFMDGINGMAVAQTVVAGLGFAVMGLRFSSSILVLLGVAIAGAGLGFAPFNVPRARLFLGDVGSYFIGSWLALTSVVALRAGTPPEVVVVPFVLYLLDTGITLLRRHRRGASLFSAHREHAYQRLVQAGRSHAQVSAIAACVMGSSTAAAVWASRSGVVARSVALVAAILAGVGFVVLPSVTSGAIRTRQTSAG